MVSQISWYHARMRQIPVFALALALAACGSKKSSDGKDKPKEAKSGDSTEDKGDSKVSPSDYKSDGSPEAEMVSNLAGLHIDKLGNPVLRWDHIPPVIAGKDRPHKLLVLLVEYSDRKFDRFSGDADQGSKLSQYYQDQLFDEKHAKIDTLSHYYNTQSLGQYHVVGEVLKPITLPKDRSHYGSPHRPAGGNWRNDSAAEELIADALKTAHSTYPDLNWSDFDRWDPEDYDNDKKLDEGDGYLDHFVVVFAGGGQSSCEGLHKVGDVLTSNVQMKEGLKLLSKEQRECANRIWPHRSKVKANDGSGPKLGGIENPGGGLPVSDTLWVRDYNAQSEYTGASTFIHEFGHSIGLPDIYSRTSSNSTGGWEVMSGTASPSPQNMSSWSRLMLGWLKPKVIKPPAFGGESTVDFALRTLDDPAGVKGDSERAAMIILPPKKKKIELTTLPEASGKLALYSGQGNELSRTAKLDLDLSTVSDAAELSFDAWWEIEPGWDFAYLEISSDGGKSWQRKLPVNAAHMPAKHGHDGKTTQPGFTGVSGDLDGDGKNESNPDCDPKAELPHGEDKDATNLSPCLKPSWVRPAFDLAEYKGKKIAVRLRYYTDGAAVMRGMLIDNVQVSGLSVDGNFEEETHKGWTLDGFSPSTGSHDLLVPHFYLVEYRDPYANSEGNHRYDSALAKAGPLFYANPANSKEILAVQVRNRPGVVLWYYNGAYAWSENDPSINGPGQGYLLVVDSNTSELKLPSLEDWFKGDKAANDTHYDVKGEQAQNALRDAYAATTCFVRSPSYLPKTGLDTKQRQLFDCGKKDAPVRGIEIDGRKLRYSYEIYNEVLPGEARLAFAPVSELLDTRKRKDKLSYRLRDRSLRHLHTKDAPFSADVFKDGLQFFKVGKTGLEPVSSADYPASPSFNDEKPGQHLNAKLPFGGVVLPTEGLSLVVKPSSKDEAGHTQVKLHLDWAKADKK